MILTKLIVLFIFHDMNETSNEKIFHYKEIYVRYLLKSLKEEIICQRIYVLHKSGKTSENIEKS